MAKAVVVELFNDYKRRHPDEVLPSQGRSQHSEHMSEFDRYNILDDLLDDLDKGDELGRYLGEERIPRHVDPLRWWEVANERYPVLRHFAFDTIAAPASSSGDKRVFSMACLMLDDEHFNTKSAFAEVQQCLKGYEAAGLYREALEDQRPCAADRSIERASRPGPLPAARTRPPARPSILVSSGGSDSEDDSSEPEQAQQTAGRPRPIHR